MNFEEVLKNTTKETKELKTRLEQAEKARREEEDRLYKEGCLKNIDNYVTTLKNECLQAARNGKSEFKYHFSPSKAGMYTIRNEVIGKLRDIGLKVKVQEGYLEEECDKDSRETFGGYYYTDVEITW